jgi:aspartyl-tRNA(Asn)/glutamyl-tRNA(Gln) amidotransferase subunit C
MSVSMEDVERVAELANLDLAAEEKPRMQRDLNAILEYVAQLNALDTAGVEPLAQVSDLLSVSAARDAGEGAALRPDAQRPCLDRAQVMEEAPETDGTFFKVPKVIER